ncbi:hypothetical protein [Clostridium sp.]|uniref:hypothetical protein n=1 Tax=Clostridium sp. TaxID=1506 RepID=UPI003F67F91D
MIFLEKLERTRDKCSCSSQAKYKLTIGKNQAIYFCEECSRYVLNRLQELEGIEAKENLNGKTYSRDTFTANFKHWSESEDKFLKETELNPKQISKELGRTEAAVRRRLNKLDIKPNR